MKPHRLVALICGTTLSGICWGGPVAPLMPVPLSPAPTPKPAAPAPAPAPSLAPALGGAKPAVIAPAPVSLPVPGGAKPVPVLPVLGGSTPPPPSKPLAPAVAPLAVPALPVLGAPTPPTPPKPQAPALASPSPVQAADRPALAPVAIPVDASKAQVDAGNFKVRVDTTGLSTGAPEKKGGLADVARERAQIPDDDKQSANKFGDKSGLIGETVIKGVRYGDTFRGEQINEQHTGDTRNFGGTGQDQAGGGTAGGGGTGSGSAGSSSHGSTTGTSGSTGSERTGRSSLGDMSEGRGSGRSGGAGQGNGGTGGGGNEGDRGGGGQGGGGKTSEDIATMLRMEGGTPTGDSDRDTAELGYAQSVGGAGYAATKDMTQAERKAYWESQREGQAQGSDVSRPREDDMGGGGGRLFGTPEMKKQQLKDIGKAVSARKNAADGGSDDQRVEQSGSGGPVIQVQGKDDKPVASEAAGAINYNKVLEINTKINPKRN